MSEQTEQCEGNTGNPSKVGKQEDESISSGKGGSEKEDGR